MISTPWDTTAGQVAAKQGQGAEVSIAGENYELENNNWDAIGLTNPGPTVIGPAPGPLAQPSPAATAAAAVAAAQVPVSTPVSSEFSPPASNPNYVGTYVDYSTGVPVSTDTSSTSFLSSIPIWAWIAAGVGALFLFGGGSGGHHR